MNPMDAEIARVYAEALQRLSRMLVAPGVNKAQREKLLLALRNLHDAYACVGQTGIAARAVVLNTLAAALHGVAAEVAPTNATNPDALTKAAEHARQLLMQIAREVFPPAPSDGQVTDTHSAVASEGPVPPVATSKVPSAHRAEYERRFAECVVLPSKSGVVDGYITKLTANRARYDAVGASMGIPWWFIGGIHALESAFAFDRHLHNGDPLSARTRRVPANRPVIGAPPFTWEESAADALVYQKLDQWDDWSLAGALYKWEAYNGFGYRKRGIPSPYLWSFSNQYSKGRYVRDHIFDPNAVSNQCGTAVLLRVLMNSGIVK